MLKSNRILLLLALSLSFFNVSTHAAEDAGHGHDYRTFHSSGHIDYGKIEDSYTSDLVMYLAGNQFMVMEELIQDFLSKHKNIKTVYVDSAREAIEAVSDQRADVAVYDAPIMRYILTHEYDHDMQVLPQEFARQDYAIGLPSDSPLREPINQTLLRHTATPVWQDTLFKYLGN